MAGRLEGKVALITGAARGQGRAHAVRLAEEGADIIALDICGPIEGREGIPASSADDLAETARQVEARDRRICTFVGDTRRMADVQAAVDGGLAEFGRLDIAVANAGTGGGGALSHEISEEDWRTTLDVNLTGVWHTAKAVLPTMIAAKGGSLILVSSGAGIRPILHLSDYAASKAGVIMLTKVLALENGAHGIRVNAVAPGPVWTPIQPIAKSPDELEKLGQDTPIGRAGQPAELAPAYVLLASAEGSYITGAVIAVTGGVPIS